MTKEIRIIQYGIGPIGAGIVRLLLEKRDMRFVGAIDIDPPGSARTPVWSLVLGVN